MKHPVYDFFRMRVPLHVVHGLLSVLQYHHHHRRVYEGLGVFPVP